MATLNDFVKVVTIPTSTPGVQTTKLEVDPNAPPEVLEAVRRAQSASQDLGGVGGLAPDQLLRNTQALLGPNWTANSVGNASINQQTAAERTAIQGGQPTAQPPAAQTQATNMSSLLDATNTNNAPTQQSGWGDLLSVTPTTTQQPTQNVVGPVVTQPAVTQQPVVGGQPATGAAVGNYATLDNAQAYLNANPQVAQEIIANAGASMNGRTPAQWLVDHISQTEAQSGGGRFTTALNQFGQQNNLQPVQPTATAPNIPQVPGENYRQNQAGTQAGSYTSTGATTQQQQQQSGQTTNQTQQGTSNTNTTNQQVQNSTQAQTGGGTSTTTQQQQGTATTRAEDTLGFGSLLQGQQGGAVAQDATRTNYLTDLINTGGTAFNSQVDQAVRNSLTGPQMTGAGDSARARAAGYAAAQVARNNTQERLAAAGQLAGPSAVTTLSTAANPYIGQTTSTSGTNTGTTTGTNYANTTGTTNTTGTGTQNTNTTGTTQGTQTGWQNLVGSGTETTSGNAVGSSNQAAAGMIPEAQQVQSGGGCVLCTAGIALGQFRTIRVLRHVIRHKLVRDLPRWHSAAKGYFFTFTPIARFLLTHPRLAKFSTNLSKAVVYEELRISGRCVPFKLWPWAAHWFAHYLCTAIGHLPVPDKGVTDSVIARIAKEHNILFNFGGAK